VPFWAVEVSFEGGHVFVRVSHDPIIYEVQ
jgi:hypothetical protein